MILYPDQKCYSREIKRKLAFSVVEYRYSRIEKGIIRDNPVASLIELSNIAKQAVDTIRSEIETSTSIIVDSIKSGGTVLACGNGSSAADAQQFVGEMIGRYFLIMALTQILNRRLCHCLDLNESEQI